MEQERPRAFTPIGIFFVFGATMAAYAGFTLLFPGSPLDALWILNKQAHIQLGALGRLAGVPFFVVSLALACAAVGWFRRRRWGWILGLSIIAINVFGDIVNVAIGERVKGLFGVVIAGWLIVCITGRSIRKYFD